MTTEKNQAALCIRDRTRVMSLQSQFQSVWTEGPSVGMAKGWSWREHLRGGNKRSQRPEFREQWCEVSSGHVRWLTSWIHHSPGYLQRTWPVTVSSPVRESSLRNYGQLRGSGEGQVTLSSEAAIDNHPHPSKGWLLLLPLMILIEKGFGQGPGKMK